MCFRDVRFSERTKGDDEKGYQGIGGDLNWEIYKLRQFEDVAAAINAYSQSSESTLSNLPALLLVGSAGQGKHIYFVTLPNTKR